MNYTVNGKFYKANEGYVFHSTITDIYTKRIMLPKPEYLEVYEIVDEASIPVVDENAAIKTLFDRYGVKY